MNNKQAQHEDSLARALGGTPIESSHLSTDIQAVLDGNSDLYTAADGLTYTKWELYSEGDY